MSSCIKAFDRCVEWTGPDVPQLEIKTGDSLDTVLAKVFAAMGISASQQFDVSGIGGGDAPVSAQRATELLVAVTQNQSASNVRYDGPTFDVDLGSSTADLYQLQGRSFQALVSPTQNGSTVGVDISSAVSNLPAGYSLDSTRTKVTGAKKAGSTIIADTDRQTFAAPIDNDRFPVSVDVEAVINAPNGPVRLRRNFTITSAAVIDETMYLEAFALAQGGGGAVSQADLNKALAAQVSALKNKMDQLNNIGIVGSKNIQLSGASLASTVGVLVGKMDEIISRMDKLDNVQISTYTQGGTQQKTTTLAEAIAEVSAQAAEGLTKVSTVSTTENTTSVSSDSLTTPPTNGASTVQ